MYDPGTQVSITNPTIKKIVQHIDPKHRGKKIKVVQVDRSFEYRYIHDSGEPYVYVARPGGSGLREIARPGYGGHHVVRFMEGLASGETPGLIITRQIGANGAITIYVPAFSSFNCSDALSVARDAMLEEQGQTAVSNILAPAFGAYAGIVQAVLEAEVKTLGKATSTKKKAKSTAARLDREIDAFVRRAGGS